MGNVFDKIIFKLFRWKVTRTVEFDKRAFQNKSVLVAEKDGKMGLILRFGYPGNLQFHELFGDDLLLFETAYQEALKSLSGSTCDQSVKADE